MLEKEVEKALVKRVKGLGGICLKLVSPSMDGLPDRMVFLPESHFAFVELKAKGKKPRPLQLKRMADFKRLGFRSFVIDDKEQIGGVIDEILST
ncbi:VRR-NUC domain-containing protein [Peptostreptococcus equinus]|uniref:VRR-NUC domain-containing protein n=1 Tax=Peptostreptococcus equinus TaxID=3003601 RepID=A0ABY7JL65_9FIRM|nr:VRR-NUC domain-containing protein [Peptostreptococcus sp. CBA3647]WAW14095.1 VRR-NUC domain-containing protein [Peptostreptococcus sp. CBA3647]